MTAQQPQQSPISVNTATADLIWILSTLLAIKYWLLQYPAWWTFAGPISLTITCIVATWRLKRQGQSWRSLGLFNYPGHLRLLLWTLLALALTIFGGSFLASVLNQLMEPALSENINSYNQNRFANVPGNWPVYLYWITISWVIGGFIEEMLFRGFLIIRTEQALAKVPMAIVWAILLQAILFGQQHHYYQGMNGFIETGIIAVISGVLFVVFKRTLWPLILSHALANTIGITSLFLSGT